jgi:hypothetical protein
MTRPHEPWRVDRTIPLALIGSILLQSGMASWWASGITQRVENLETWRQESKSVAADIAVVRSQVLDLKDVLRRIDSRIQSQNSN